MDIVADSLSWLLLTSGAFFVVVGALGMLRLPDFFSRLHAVSVCDSIGAGLILAGLMLQGGFSLVTVKLLLIFYFMIFTGPTATHVLAQAALQGRLKPLTDDGKE